MSPTDGLPPDWDDIANADPFLLARVIEGYENVIAGYGSRLRARSREQLVFAQKMILRNSGVVYIEMIPPSPSDPIEIRAFPWGTSIQVLGERIG